MAPVHGDDRTRVIALVALFAGASASASSALFVKVSEAGPVATAFWRVALALPVLWTWSLMVRGNDHTEDFRRNRGMLIRAALFSAGDLAVWHWSIMLTTVANATLLANLAPIFVTLTVWVLYGRRPNALFLAGLVAALAGTILLLGGDFRLFGKALAGDLLGVLTAMFYAGYQLTVTRLRSEVSTASLMAWSGLITAVALLPLALASGEQIVPQTAGGWMKLVGLALISQVTGQSLIAYAMAHLPATFSSVGLLLQPVMAALFAWMLLGEMLGAFEIVGGCIVLIGIRLAHVAELRPGH